MSISICLQVPMSISIKALIFTVVTILDLLKYILRLLGPFQDSCLTS